MTNTTPETCAIQQAMTRIRKASIDGQDWYSLADVCREVGIKPYKNGRYGRRLDFLDSHERRLVSFGDAGLKRTGRGGSTNFAAISLSGLYKLALRSDLPVWRPCIRYVTGCVLPLLDQHGSYVRGDEALHSGTASDVVISMLRGSAEIMRLRLAATAESIAFLSSKASASPSLGMLGKECSRIAADEVVA